MGDGLGVVAAISYGLSSGDGDGAKRAVVTALVVLWAARLAVQLACVERAPLSAPALAGVGLWCVGMIFEAGGDWQLTRFRNQAGGSGRVLDRGL